MKGDGEDSSLRPPRPQSAMRSALPRAPPSPSTRFNESAKPGVTTPMHPIRNSAELRPVSALPSSVPSAASLRMASPKPSKLDVNPSLELGGLLISGSTPAPSAQSPPHAHSSARPPSASSQVARQLKLSQSHNNREPVTSSSRKPQFQQLELRGHGSASSPTKSQSSRSYTPQQDDDDDEDDYDRYEEISRDHQDENDYGADEFEEPEELDAGISNGSDFGSPSRRNGNIASNSKRSNAVSSSSVSKSSSSSGLKGSDAVMRSSAGYRWVGAMPDNVRQQIYQTLGNENVERAEGEQEDDEKYGEDESAVDVSLESSSSAARKNSGSHIVPIRLPRRDRDNQEDEEELPSESTEQLRALEDQRSALKNAQRMMEEALGLFTPRTAASLVNGFEGRDESSSPRKQRQQPQQQQQQQPSSSRIRSTPPASPSLYQKQPAAASVTTPGRVQITTPGRVQNALMSPKSSRRRPFLFTSLQQAATLIQRWWRFIRERKRQVSQLKDLFRERRNRIGDTPSSASASHRPSPPVGNVSAMYLQAQAEEEAKEAAAAKRKREKEEKARQERAAAIADLNKKREEKRLQQLKEVEEEKKRKEQEEEQARAEKAKRLAAVSAAAAVARANMTPRSQSVSGTRPSSAMAQPSPSSARKPTPVAAVVGPTPSAPTSIPIPKKASGAKPTIPASPSLSAGSSHPQPSQQVVESQSSPRQDVPDEIVDDESEDIQFAVDNKHAVFASAPPSAAAPAAAGIVSNSSQSSPSSSSHQEQRVPSIPSSPSSAISQHQHESQISQNVSISNNSSNVVQSPIPAQSVSPPPAFISSSSAPTITRTLPPPIDISSISSASSSLQPQPMHQPSIVSSYPSPAPAISSPTRSVIVESRRNNDQNNSNAQLSDDKLSTIMQYLDEVETARQSHIDSSLSDSMHHGNQPYDAGLLTSRTDIFSDVSRSASQYGAPPRSLHPAGSEMDASSAMAISVYDGVRSKMMALQIEVETRNKDVAELKAKIEKFRRREEAIVRKFRETEKTKLQSQRQELEAIIQRHLTFINSLLADKEDLNRKCERLAGELKEVEDKFSKRLEEAKNEWAHELKKQKEQWAISERARREQWAAEKSKEIKEQTVRGLEPELQRLIQKHKTEVKRLEELHEEEMKRQKETLMSQSDRSVRDLKDKLEHDAEELVKREREALRQRFREQAEKHEEQLAQLRARFSQDLLTERDRTEAQVRLERQAQTDALQRAREAEHDANRRADERVEKAKEESARRHAAEISTLKERWELERDHWQQQLIKRLENEYKDKEKQLMDRLTRQNEDEIEAVITRLGDETIQTKQTLEREKTEAIAREKAKAQEDVTAAKESEKRWSEKFMLTQRTLQASQDEAHKLKSRLEVLEAQIDMIDSERQDLRNASALFDSKLQDHAAKVRQECEAKVRQEAELRMLAEQNLQEARREAERIADAHAEELADVRRRKAAELDQLNLRVRQTVAKKDETIAQLRDQANMAELRARQLEGLLERQRRELLGS